MMVIKSLLQLGKGNAKLRKDDRDGKYRVVHLSMLPWKDAGIGNLCPHSTVACRAGCVSKQGVAAIFKDHVEEARKKKTIAFYTKREWFMEQLRMELEWHLEIADRRNQIVACRLNTYSDYPFEKSGIIDEFNRIEFFDYTRNPRRVGLLRDNYWTTYSGEPETEETAKEFLKNGKNVAIIFADSRKEFVTNQADMQRLPKTWRGYTVIDGNKSDLRFLDKRPKPGCRGFVVGLKLRSSSKADRRRSIDNQLCYVI